MALIIGIIGNAGIQAEGNPVITYLQTDFRIRRSVHESGNVQRI